MIKHIFFIMTLFFSGSCFAEEIIIPAVSDTVNWAMQAAEDGNAEAQATLGEMYYKGVGVPQNYNEAAKWSLKAAEQGVRDAQSFMGIAYFLGIGVPKDFILAHMWLNISSMTGDKGIEESRALVEKNMSRAEISKAQMLAVQWVSHKNQESQ